MLSSAFADDYLSKHFCYIVLKPQKRIPTRLNFGDNANESFSLRGSYMTKVSSVYETFLSYAQILMNVEGGVGLKIIKHKTPFRGT